MNFVDLSEEALLGLSIEGVLVGAPEERGLDTRLYVDTLKVYPEGGVGQVVTGRVRLSVRDRRVEGLRRGDSVRLLAKLKRPRNFGNPGGFDYEWWLKRKGIAVTGRVKSADLIVKLDRVPGVGTLPGRVMDSIRESVGSFIVPSVGESRFREAGILKALVTGDKNSIDGQTLLAFRRTGTAHILAISGLHVGTVALFSFFIFFFIFRFSERLALTLNIKKLAWLLALVPVFFYGFMAGFSISTERAVIMVTAFVVSFLLDRFRAHYATLALAALVVLVIEPGSLWEVSFQFSFVAVLAIMYLVPKMRIFFTPEEDPLKEVAWSGWRFRFNQVFRRAGLLVLITVAASVGTFPLAVYHFNMVSSVGILLNLVVVPVVGFIVVPLSLLSAALLPVSSALSTLLLTTADFVLIPVVVLVKAVSGLSWSSTWLSTPSIIEVIAFYLLVVAIFEFKKRRYLKYAFPVLVICLLAPTFYSRVDAAVSDELKIIFLSVGQGESTFVEFPGGVTMLIDGGSSYPGGFDLGEMVVSPYLRSERIKRIDYMVLSHAQRDHMGGLGFIANNFQVGEFWWNGIGDLSILGEAVRENEIKSVILDATFPPLDINGVKVEILNPPPGFAFEEASGPSLNEGSLVLKLTYGEKRVLLTGDIGFEAEQRLSGRDLGTDILKAPHHGSKYSSSVSFLKETAPPYVVVSAGYNNIFGFPNKDTLERYKEAGAKVFRTDLDGAITAVTDGKGLRFETVR